jgi:hypothetical protein
MDLSNPKALAQRGEEIYNEKYRSDYEGRFAGKFVAIDVTSGAAYLADSPEDAVKKARANAPQGLFHLVRVGSAGAFRVSYSNDINVDWLFR